MPDKIHEVLFGMTDHIGDGSSVLLLLVVILLLLAVLIVLVYKAQRSAHRCCAEQAKLNVLFDDQMFLFGKYYKELQNLKDMLARFKKFLQIEETPESAEASIAPADRLAGEVPPVPDVSNSGTSSGRFLGEERKKGDDYAEPIAEGKKLVEKRIKELAKQSSIEITQVDWYKKPSMISEYPYIFMISNGAGIRECAFSERELVDFFSGNRTSEAKLRALINEVKQNSG
jgi:hypothetical protein